MIIVEGIAQNSPEWDELRLGLPTSSRFGEIFTATGQHSKSRDKYMRVLAGEIITGRRHEGWTGKVFDRGHENEAESRMAYEIKHDVTISQPAFVFKDEDRRFGCSPDGLMRYDGGLMKRGFETKDAAPHVQLERYEGWTFAEYHRQVHGSMMVTGLESWVLVSYCSGMKPIEIIVERDEKLCKIFEDEVNRFCDELDALVRLRA